MTSGPPSTVGVLLVHGIGEQKRGDTLLRCGEPLCNWLQSWLEGAGEKRDAPADVVISSAVLLDPDQPAHTRVDGRIQGDEPVELHWFLAEAWWAEAFPAPKASSVIRWMLSFGPRVLRGYFKRTYDDADELLGLDAEPSDAFEWGFLFWWRASGVGLGLTYGTKAVAALCLLISIVVLWVVLLGLLPLALVPALRPMIQRLQLRLANSVGDSYALLKSPLRFGAMVEKVRRDLAWLDERCDRVAIVAHSQGSVVAFKALMELDAPKVHLFITYGSALRLLTRQELTLPRLGSSLEWHDLYASADPVPLGPLWASEGPGRSTTSIDNSGSVFTDHSGYWRNTEQFVAVIAERLARLGGTELAELTSHDSNVLTVARRLRTFRVSWLQISRWITGLAAVPILWEVGDMRLHWLGYHSVRPLHAFFSVFWKGAAHQVREVSTDPRAQWLIGALLVVACLVLFYRIVLRLLWNWWNGCATRQTSARADASCPIQRSAFAAAAMLLPFGIPAANIALHFARGEKFSPWYFLFTVSVLAPFWGAYADYLTTTQPPQLKPTEIELGGEYALTEEETAWGRFPRCSRVRVIETGVTRLFLTDGIRVEVIEKSRRKHWWSARSATPGIGKAQVVSPRKLYARWEDYAAWWEARYPGRPPATRRDELQ